MTGHLWKVLVFFFFSYAGGHSQKNGTHFSAQYRFMDELNAIMSE